MLSRRHLFSKLVLAAPCSFLSAAIVLHVLPVSRTHFFMKLVRAAPCKFLSVAREWQVSAMAALAQNDSARASENTFVILPPQGAIQVNAAKIYAPSKL